MRVMATLLVLIAAFGAAGPANAQVALREGVRIRIEGEGRQLVGALIQVRLDSVILATDRELRDGLRRTAIHRFEVSRGARRATVLGATIGLVSLGVGALLYGAAESATCEVSCGRANDAATFAAIGALAGGIGGSFFLRERWERVMLPGTLLPDARDGAEIHQRGAASRR